MRPIPLQELKLLGEGQRWPVDQKLAPLNSLGPVQGFVRALHRGNDLLVSGEGRTQVELCCDRCLQVFVYRLAAKAEEAIALGDPTAPDDPEVLQELGGASPMETLDPAGSFDPEHWLFEQLSLQLPLKRLCRLDCPGILPEEVRGPARPDPIAVDPRWLALQQLMVPPPAGQISSGELADEQ